MVMVEMAGSQKEVANTGPMDRNVSQNGEYCRGRYTVWAMSVGRECCSCMPM